MQDIPKILEGKIFEERFDPDIFDYKEQRDTDQKFYQKGSIRFNGVPKKCFFLTGTWNEYSYPKLPPVKFQAVTHGVDFSTVVIAKNESEARRKILQMIKKAKVSQTEIEYTLEPAYLQLKAKARGVKQEPWRKEVRRWALILYTWVRSEMIDNIKGERYPDIEEELKKLGIKRGQWKSANAAQKLTYHLVKKVWPQFKVDFGTFKTHYLSHTEKNTVMLLYTEVSWTDIANKFFHHGIPVLWLLNYEDKGETLIIKRPEEDQILSQEPLKCSFKVYRGGENWEKMVLTCKRDAKNGLYYWWDNE